MAKDTRPARGATKRGAVLAYVVQHPGKARLIGHTECSTELCRQFARACQMLRNCLHSAVLGNVRKVLRHVHLKFCRISPT